MPIFHRCDHSRCDKTIDVLRDLVTDMKKHVADREKLLLDMHGEGVENESRRLQHETYGRLQELGMEYQIKGARPFVAAPSPGPSNGSVRAEPGSPLDEEEPAPPASERAHVTGERTG